MVPFTFEDGEDVEGDDDGDGLAGHGGVDDAFTALVAVRHDVERRGFDAHDGKGRGFRSGCRSPEKEPVVGLRHVGGAPRRPPRLESHTPSVRGHGAPERDFLTVSAYLACRTGARAVQCTDGTPVLGGEVKPLGLGVSCR